MRKTRRALPMLAIYTVSRLRPAFGGMRAKQLRRLLRRQGVEVRDVGPGDSGWVTLAQLQEHCPDIARALGLLGRAEQLEAAAERQWDDAERGP